MKNAQTTNSSRAADQLHIYQKYSEMARQAHDREMRVVFNCLAQEALRQAAILDPAAVAHISALAMAKVG